MPRAQSEYEVEDIFIDKLTTMGYDYVQLNNYDDVIKNFRIQLCKLNEKALKEAKGEAKLSDAEFDKVMLRLDGHTVYESAKILREQWVLELDNGKSVYLEFLTDDSTRNIFQVAHQITMDKAHMKDVIYKNRYDVTLLINGLPLVQVELKRPGVEINEAVNQINRYRRFSFKGLFRYIQIFVVSNSTQTKYFANVNERDADGEEQNVLKSLVFYWTDSVNKRINRLMEFTSDFLTRFNITEMLTKFMIIKKTEPTLIVLRPYQIYSVKRSIDRIMLSNMNGFNFACTGSGKTISSYMLATTLRDDRRIDKVFFLIDSKDLDDQTVDEYNSFDPGCVDATDSTKELVKMLENSSKKMIITTIQKMANALRNKRYTDIMDTYKTKKCIFIIDECHRSQFGKMHAEIKKHFQNANYIGFTGTPIFKENKGATGRTTADVFYSGDKVDACIHKYMIKEAIADGNVLRFSVEYMRSISAKQIQKEGLDPTKIDDPEYCKQHHIDIDELYHDPQRIAFVADDILKNLDRHTHPEGKDVYTAIFATDKIKTLMEYYHYMKNHNPDGKKIAAIFTFTANEDLDEGQDKYSRQYLEECMKDYNEIFGTSFDIETFDGYRKDIAKRLKQKDLPQVDLLLVVDMFLTGFDSKATNTLILDKNLVWHNLVQAYSRTNRVSKVTKQFGQIITYRNIKKAQDDALKLFSGDGDPNEYLLESYEYYLSEYRKQCEDLRQITPTPDDAGELVDENQQRDYVFAFRKIAHTLAVLKTFSKFDWDDIDAILDEQNYSDYKGWYLTFYDEMKKSEKTGKQSILADIDFNIELVRTDKINVVYILNLLKDINRNNKEEMEKSIDLVLREIERSDNEKMRYKQDIMKSFITTRFFDLDPDEDIEAAFEQYEREMLESSIKNFAEDHGISAGLVSDLLNKYFTDENSISREMIRNQIKELNLGLLKTTKIINDLQIFIEDMFDKFTAEGN